MSAVRSRPRYGERLGATQTVAEIMMKPVITATPDTTAAAARRMLTDAAEDLGERCYANRDTES